jgi:nitroreductase
MNLNEIIRQRRAVFPATYVAKTIPNDIIWEILENANHAPTHKLTQPWRFKVITAQKLVEMGQILAAIYKRDNETNFSETRYQKIINQPARASHIIALCLQRDQSLPEWEEVAALAMAVQNMWLTAFDKGLGAYWSSPTTCKSAEIAEFLQLPNTETCWGFFYLGYHQLPAAAAQRTPVAEKTIWL